MYSNLELPLCICCGGTTVDFDFRDPFLGNLLRTCQKCGHVQIKVAPSQSVVKDYYQNCYSIQRGGNLGPAYERIMVKRAAAQVEYIQQHLSLDGASITDIGCGFGHLLLSVSRFTDKLKGYDYDPLAVDSCKAKGLPVEFLETEDQLYDIPPADLYTLSHCLEHLIDPGVALRSLGEKCTYIFIEVPLYKPDIKEQFKDLEGHMNFFTMGSLQSFFHKNGFTIVDITACGPSMNIFYLKRWGAVCRLLQTVTDDFFINQYEVSRQTGMWGRALIRCSG